MSATLTAIPLEVAVSYTEDGDPFLFRRARTWWLLLALFIMSEANGIFTVATGQGQSLLRVRQYYDVSTPLLLLSTVALWGIVVALMVKRLRPMVQMMQNQKAILAFTILAFISTLWSQDPQITFKKAVLLFLTFAFAWFFASSYSPTDQMRVFLALGVIMGLTSIAMVILLPQYGLDMGGAWKGVFPQKNGLGSTMFLLFSGLLFCRISSRRRLHTVVLQSLFPIGLILLSRSKESFVSAAVLVAVRLYGPFVASRRRDQLPFVLFATVASLFTVALGRGIILFLLGRDSTLSGRTDEWAILVPFAFRHFWLGYGYQAFWTGTGDSLLAMRAVGGAMRGADSGYLDTMLQFGIAGIALWLIVLLTTAKDFVRLYQGNLLSLTAYWYAGLVLAIFILNFVGSATLAPNNIAAFSFVVACAGLRNLSRENALSVEIR
jgi:exopolysaccharide production protein ExoQ